MNPNRREFLQSMSALPLIPFAHWIPESPAKPGTPRLLYRLAMHNPRLNTESVRLYDGGNLKLALHLPPRTSAIAPFRQGLPFHRLRILHHPAVSVEPTYK